MKFNAKFNIALILFSYIFGMFIFSRRPNLRMPANKPITSVSKYDRTYLAINQDKIKLKGFGHVQGHDGKYMQRLFGEIIQKAHLYSAKDFYFPEKSIFLYYNTFLLNSLLVPFHESSLMHLTRRSTDFCYLANDFVDKSFHGEESSTVFLNKILDESENDEELLKKKELLSNPDDVTLDKWIKKSAVTGKIIVYYLD